MNHFFKLHNKDNDSKIIERLEQIEKQLQSTQNAIADLKRDLPVYFTKALRDYYKRGFPL